MSEEILKALTQLFAIITKQDGGVTERERNFVLQFFQQQLAQDAVKEYIALYDKFSDEGKEEEAATEEGAEKEGKKRKLTSVRDSVKTLGICKKINKTLTQKQKFIALVKLLELVAIDKNFTPQRMQIIDTVSDVFNIRNEEYKMIESFVVQEAITELDYSDILIADCRENPPLANAKHIFSDKLSGEIIFLCIKSEDMYFVKYTGHSETFLNGFIVAPHRIYLYSHGSTIKASKGAPLYYSDVVNNFMSDAKSNNLSLNVNNMDFRFPNGAIGLRNINISEGPGRLIAIMGGSGAGKTTLLNVLAGIESPSAGEVLINGINIHKENDKIKGIIGYIAQDDILLEELTVFQNLYYNAKLCFKDMPEAELVKKVDDTLASLGLLHIKHITVGNVMNKKISGGQRKRLNIALELIREPAVMFVDEPTSGLSSRDSENVIDLLKELSLKGKLIFVVIHQPSSDIYKMFDKLFLLDTGGYPIFYGNPVEAVTYFKTTTNQIDSDRGQCPTCGNVNPEQVFNIVEALVVDEYGQFTNVRKITPVQWNEQYIKNFNVEKREDVRENPPQSLNIPSKIIQFAVFTVRDFLSKVTNTQYMLINLLEAPLLAFLLAFIIRFRNAPNTHDYVFRYNDNVPAFILISIIVSLFMGLTVSAEEIIRDRKIQRREKFLNLSRTSYLLSKITILFLLSAVQTLTFVMIGNYILDIPGMTGTYWLVLFTISCFANILGLNISATFNSAVTIYIIIPLLLIPQMILSGAIFNFDKLNDDVSAKGRVPLLADFMASRWGFEAITVEQFKNNDYQDIIFKVEKAESVANYYQTYFLPELVSRLNYCSANYTAKDVETREKVAKELLIIRNSLDSDKLEKYTKGMDLDKELSLENFNANTANVVRGYIEEAEKYYTERYNKANQKKDEALGKYEANPSTEYSLTELKNKHFNESLSDLVRNVATKNKFIEFKSHIVQQVDPIYNEPDMLRSPVDYRTHFFAPDKPFLGNTFGTYYFNVIVIWLMSIFLYFTLYFESLKKVLDWFGYLIDKLALIQIPEKWKQKLSFRKKIEEVVVKTKKKAAAIPRIKKDLE